MLLFPRLYAFSLVNKVLLHCRVADKMHSVCENHYFLIVEKIYTKMSSVQGLSVLTAIRPLNIDVIVLQSLTSLDFSQS